MWGSQYNRIQRDNVLAEEVRLITGTGSDGKQYKMSCLPVEFLPGWLFGITTSKVKPEYADKLTRYRRECFRILWQAFQSRAVATDVIPQLVSDQAETRARVNTIEQDVKAIDQSVKAMKVILSELRGLSTVHRATAQKMVNEISRISGVKHLSIWSDLKDVFHVASYTDIDDERWPDVQKWLQHRLNSARQGKGIEEQPSLFDE
jgi:hypothetical protein